MDLGSIELMLATNARPFSREGWIFDFKYDGYRVLASKEQLLTRKQKYPGGVTCALLKERLRFQCGA